jgi:hypothetical protein
MSLFSTPALLMARPFRGYAELAAEDGEARPAVTRGMFRFLFVFGAFVALTATGRLAPMELGSAMISFAYVPVVHAAAAALALRVVAPPMPLSRALALYTESYGPWFLFVLLIAGGTIFAPEPVRLLSVAFAGLALGGIAWSGLLTYACFRSGLGLSRLRAAAALAIHHVIILGLYLLYFLAAGQLLPILPW